jgi:hypothetical protein
LFTKPPTKLTDMNAYFNYLEHQSEQRHNETVAQRTQDYNRVSSAARRSMTPEKIKQLSLAKREKREAIRALRQVKRDDERRMEEEQLQKKVLETAGARNLKHKSSGGSILIHGMWIGKRGGLQWTSDAPRICLLTLENISKMNEHRTKETMREN